MNRPTDSVRIVIFNRDHPEEFLVVTEPDDPANWKLPGGKFNSSTETPIEAAGRENLEEVGVQGGAINLSHAGELTNEDGVSARHIFAAIAAATDLSPTEELAETRWVNVQTVPDGPNRLHILTAVQLAQTVRSAISAV